VTLNCAKVSLLWILPLHHEAIINDAVKCLSHMNELFTQGVPEKKLDCFWRARTFL